MPPENGGNRQTKADSESHSGLRLRIPTLISACFLALVAISAAYVLGVMSGRQSLPSTRENSLPVSEAQPSSSKTGKDLAPKPAEPILSARELEFARVLRREENGPLNKLKGNQEKGSEQKEAEPPAAESQPKASLQKSLETEQSAEISDFLFQVGSFKDEKTVDNLREKLEGHGLRTMMQRDGKLFLVLVRLRGSPARAAELVALFNELGLGEPILRSRTAVSQ